MTTPLGNGKNIGLREDHGEMDKYLSISIDMIFLWLFYTNHRTQRWNSQEVFQKMITLYTLHSKTLPVDATNLYFVKDR